MSDLLQDRVLAALGDHYDIEQEIGRGGMAVVYRALDRRLKRRVAIKVLPPDLAFRDDVRQRFLREAEMSAQLGHPNIVPIYSVDERGGVSFFVMALIDGETLAERLKREPRPPLADVRRILHDVADALAYAHAHGVTHRDIKPDNIMLDARSGRPVVTDFGIARAAEADSRLTVTGVAVGTPAYMSPEQAMGESEIDGRSDIYSLGVVGYLMLAGRLPFEAANTPAMLVKQISEMPRALHELRPDIPSSLDAALARALAKRPADRWASAADFRDALSSTAAPPPPGPLPWEHQRAVPADAPAVAPRGEAPSPSRGPGLPFQPLPALPPLPVMPAGMLSRRERRELRRVYGWRFPADGSAPVQRTLDQRISSFRQRLIANGATIGMLFGINMLTAPHFPWFLFPALGMGTGLVKGWSGLWEEGVTWKQLWSRRPSALPAPPPGPSADSELASLASATVLAGPHGAAVRKAAADRATILGIVASLEKPDRELLPEIVPTVDALVERSAALAVMLHHLDSDVSPDIVAQIETRIAAVEREPDVAADRERRLGLLQRQRSTLRELGERRVKVAAQLESAGIALQNLKLDLLKLRSSGVQAALNDVSSATREARAVSKEIGHVLDAAAELRAL